MNNIDDISNYDIQPIKKQCIESESTMNDKIEQIRDERNIIKTKSISQKSKFYDDLEEMMYGFGDNWPPQKDSVQLIESMAIKYIDNLGKRAIEISEIKAGKLDKECFLYLVRKDRHKFNRVINLLKINEEFKKIQKTEMKEDENDCINQL